MRRAVRVLGVVAALSVVVSAALALTGSPDSATSARQWLRGSGLEVAVPITRWRLEPATAAIRYDAHALVRAPAVLDAGFCPSSPSSSRAFVGILRPEPGALREVLGRDLATWTGAISGPAYGISGELGSRVDVDVPVPAGPCAPTTAHLTLVGRDTAAGVVVLVLVRDVGEPDDLSAADAETILASLRPAARPGGS